MRITAVSLARFAEARLAGGNRSPDTPGHAATAGYDRTNGGGDPAGTSR